MNETPVPRLERSCGPNSADWMRVAPSCRGIERIESFFSGHAFDPHRHDTYAVGFTLRGVQAFKYRGAAKHSLPGHMFVLHPDETHDGHAGTADGFCYKLAYVEPAVIQEALGEPHRPLPFVREAVSTNSGLAAAVAPLLDNLDRPLEELERDELLVNLADALSALDPSAHRSKVSAPHWQAVRKARDLLDAHVEQGVASAELEAATGLSRYALARHFRACLGTSPYRYLIQRRLDRARALILGGTALADAALVAGFADQSHMTRQFKLAYGMSPGQWSALILRRPRR